MFQICGGGDGGEARKSKRTKEKQGKARESKEKQRKARKSKEDQGKAMEKQ